MDRDMKHLFIVNPIAGGRHHDYKKTVQDIDDAMRENGGEYEIYITKSPHDATEKVRLEAKKGDAIRIYACGGDGTLNECVNGAVGFGNVSVTNYPCGTGNDFVKLFGDEKQLFFDIRRLINGFSEPIDVIRCNDMYSINICSVGFDARVGGDVHKYDKIPLLSGFGSYVVSLIVNFFSGINEKLTINTGDGDKSGEYALICSCNGRYYGGGFNPISDAMPNDGVMNTIVVSKCSRLNFIRMIKKYSTGRYYEAGNLAKRYDGNMITISSDKELSINVDGEILKSRSVVFELVHKGVNLLCPKGMKFFDSEKEIAGISK